MHPPPAMRTLLARTLTEALKRGGRNPVLLHLQACRVLPVRRLCSGERIGGDESLLLLQALRDEVRNLRVGRWEKQVAPPEPFHLRDKPGCVDVILRRDYGQERINAVCELLLHPEDDVEEPDQEEAVVCRAPYALLINLTITIVKDGPEALEISCQSHGDEYFINYVSFYEDSSRLGDDYTVHEKKISEDLKRDFLYFLFLRGFDDELAWFLYHHFENKKLEERISNFEKVEAFIHEHSKS